MVLDLIFPKVCEVCDKCSKDAICYSCDKQINMFSETELCFKCGLPFPSSDISSSTTKRFCERCLSDEFSFQLCRSVAKHDGVIKELIHKFKYRKKTRLADTFLNLMLNNFPKEFAFFNTIVPVPLYIKKLRSREYNQSGILAKLLARGLNKLFNPFSLVRIKEAKPQMELKTVTDKKRNVRGIFAVRNNKDIVGSSVLLVDDVFTTGSTVNECAGALLKSGATKVQVFTLTRAVM